MNNDHLQNISTEIVKQGGQTVLNLTGVAEQSAVTIPMLKEFLATTKGEMVIMLSIRDTGEALQTSGGAQSVEGGTDPAVVRRMIQALEENAAVLRDSLVSLYTHED